MSDDSPKLRVIDEHAAEPPEIVRLGKLGATVESVERLPGFGVRDVAARLEGEERQIFEGRSSEPGVESILSQEPVVENVEQPWGSEERKLAGIPYGWFILCVALLAGAGGWSVRQMTRGEKRLVEQREEVLERVAQDEEKEKSALEFVDGVEKAARAYLAADTLEEILPWVRDADRVGPMIEAEWRVRPKRSLRFERMTMFHPQEIGGHTFWVLGIDVEGGGSEMMIAEPDGAGGARIDWETHVCHQPMDWDRYIAERPAGEAFEFRVRAALDQQFSHEFSDSGRWVCFHLGAKDSEGHVFGYAAVGSEEARVLSELVLASQSREVPVILRLRIPADCRSPRGAVIERVVAKQWLRLDGVTTDAP